MSQAFKQKKTNSLFGFIFLKTVPVPLRAPDLIRATRQLSMLHSGDERTPCIAEPCSLRARERQTAMEVRSHIKEIHI